MITIDWNPSPRQLRQFAWIAPVGFALVGWTVHRMGGALWWPIAGLALGLVLLVLGLARPLALRPIYVLFMALAAPIGWVLSNLLVAIFYFLLITPLGLLFRLIGRDPLAVRRQSSRTAWTERPASRDPGTYYRQG